MMTGAGCGEYPNKGTYQWFVVADSRDVIQGDPATAAQMHDR
jgi:hypothetical protein